MSYTIDNARKMLAFMKVQAIRQGEPLNAWSCKIVRQMAMTTVAGAFLGPDDVRREK
jgi:hypothetical protein